MRHELHSEKLTVLPKRFETRRWGRGGNFNYVALNQQNFSHQSGGNAFGIVAYGGNLAEQNNTAVIYQN